MGGLFASVGARLMNRCCVHTRILMVGLDAAGKTTILYRLKLGQGRDYHPDECKSLTPPSAWLGGMTKPRISCRRLATHVAHPFLYAPLRL